MYKAACLIIIDVQKGVFTLKRPVYRAKDILRNLGTIIEKARRRNILVFFTQHENVSFLKRGSGGWEFVEAVQPAPGERIIPKKHPSIFEGTGLLRLLHENDITRLVVAGLVSNGCVKDSCLEALANGFDVSLVSDAHSTLYANAEKIIRDTNRQLEEKGVMLVSCREFGA